MRIENLCSSQDGLGESPLWAGEEQAVYWCDHVAARWSPGQELPYGSDRVPSLKRLHLPSRRLSVWALPEQAGSVGLRRRGGLVAGLQSGFATIELDLEDNMHLERLVDPEAGQADNRLNDGKVGPAGRFWCGSMDSRVAAETGRLYVLEPDGRCREAAPDYRFRVSNGMAFDPGATRMYFADTFRKMIVLFDYDPHEGRLTGRRDLFSTAGYPGLPDGGTVDAEGCYWVALVQGGLILRLTPEGSVDRVLEMPIPTPTCVAFGGTGYRTLFVTSQKAFLSPDQLARYPETGDLFAVHGLDVGGVPEPRFAG